MRGSLANIRKRKKQMKRTFNLLSLAVMLALIVNMLGMPAGTARAAGTWQTVGAAGFSVAVANYPSLAIANGTPYVAYQDVNTAYKATVMKFDGSNWVTGGADLEQIGTCLWEICTSPAWSAKRYMHLGVLKLTFNARSIQGAFTCGPSGGGTNDINCTQGDVIDTFTIPTGTKHFTVNEEGAYTDAEAVGFNIHDTGMSTGTINALPVGSQAMVWVGIGSSNCSTTLSSTFTSFVLANATNPKLYGFYLTDEPINDTCVAAVTAYTNYIHANAPGKKAFILLTDWPGTYAAYRPAVTNVDLIGLDPYPVKGGTYDNTLISHEINNAIAAGIPLANIVPVFQTFGGAGWDAPTASQLTTILDQWAALVPNPPLDYAYSWGTQSNYLSDALVNRADWRDIMAAHNIMKTSISGNAGVGGATLSYYDGTLKTVVADGSGDYSITVPSGWSGIVTPSKTGYKFVPISRSYSNVQSDQTDQDYAIELIKNGGLNIYTGTSKIPTSWKAANFSTTDGKTTTVKKEGAASVRITGTGINKTLSQTLLLNGLKDDAFTFSFWVKGSSIPSAGYCRAQILFYNDATLIAKKTVGCGNGTYGFNQKTLAFTAPGDYTKIVIRFTYNKASGRVWFDAVSLVR